MATRTQIYLTDEQQARLSGRAKATGRPVSELVRDASDGMLAADDDSDATFGWGMRIHRQIVGVISARSPSNVSVAVVRPPR
ncbi:MAG: ribbon-helix-helix protein, CopG family [Acidimicrobiales bacterium]